ncbi:MAG: hypothetical protein ACYTFO_09585 [Planctomycetota bacterium]
MVIPLLVGIMAAVFFMTWVRGGEQRLRMLERHVPWHVVREGALLDEGDANVKILMRRAAALEYKRGTGPGGLLNGLQWGMMGGGEYGHATKLDPTDQAMLDLADLARGTNWAGPIADEALLRNDDTDLPRGVALRVTANFPSNVGPWQAFLSTPFRGYYVREGPEWHHEQDPLLQAIVESHLREVDSMLEDVGSPGDQLAAVFQNMYLQGWPVPSDVE